MLHRTKQNKIILYLKFKCNWAFCIGSGHCIVPLTELVSWWGGTEETDSEEVNQ